MSADWGCIFRNLVRLADGLVKPMVKPGHDGVGESVSATVGSTPWDLASGLLAAGARQHQVETL
jgi:hypothetical protein